MVFFKTSNVLLAAIAILFAVSNAAPSEFVTPLKRDSDTKFPFGKKKVRGVNLGGWFVLEQVFLNPRLYLLYPTLI